MSMPVDLLAVNAGISPLLTEGKPSPPIDAMPETHEGYDWADADVVGRRRSSISSGQTGPSTRDSSESRQGKTEASTAAARAGGSGLGSATPTTTNLVTKDAIVAAAVISSLGTPAAASISSASGLQLLVLGVPSVGAKSRVETQIKISLVLVGPKRGASRRVKIEGEAEEGSQCQEGLTTSDGGLSEDAGRGLERIGSWSHIRLPKYLALKKINKKLIKPGMYSQSPLALVPRLTCFIQTRLPRTHSSSLCPSFVAQSRTTRSSSAKDASSGSTSARNARRKRAFAPSATRRLQTRTRQTRSGARSSCSTARSLSTLLRVRSYCRRGLRATADIIKSARGFRKPRRLTYCRLTYS